MRFRGRFDVCLCPDYVCFTSNNGHSEAHAGLPLLTRRRHSALLINVVAVDVFTHSGSPTDHRHRYPKSPRLGVDRTKSRRKQTSKRPRNLVPIPQSMPA